MPGRPDRHRRRDAAPVSARSGVDGPALIQRSAGTRRRWEHGAVMNSRLRPGTPTALLALCLSAWLVASPHAVFNLADRNQDFDQHLAWAFQVGQGLAAGDPYPRWMPLGNRGLGEPALLYYSPAYSLAVSLLRPLTDATWSAMRLVEFLALRHGSVVSRTQLYEHLFDENEDSLSNLLDVHVSNVRKKLGHDFIVTRRGLGYSIEA